MPARPTPADAPVTTATSDARRTKSLLLFHSGVGAVEKIRHCYAYQNPGEEPRHAWSEKQTETQSCGAPWLRLSLCVAIPNNARSSWLNFLGRRFLLGGNTCQHSHTRQVKPQQRCILREQLFLALFFVCSFSAVLFDRKIDCGFIRLCSLHTS